MDLGKMLKAKQAWEAFGKNHPKFQAFLEAFNSNEMSEGTVIEISVRYPDGKSMKSNLMVNQGDLELLGMLRKK